MDVTTTSTTNINIKMQ